MCTGAVAGPITSSTPVRPNTTLVEDFLKNISLSFWLTCNKWMIYFVLTTNIFDGALAHFI